MVQQPKENWLQHMCGLANVPRSAFLQKKKKKSSKKIP